MIVKDEAGDLARCLGSVEGLVDDVVVVDTGSADDTKEVARRAGARVVDFVWSESFAEARNESLRHARGDWIFWLDADEWLDGPAREQMRALFGRLGDENAVHLMWQSSPLAGDGRGCLTVSQPRVFRNDPAIRWRYRVHEQILESCLRRGARVCPTGVVIRHSGYESAEEARRKAERNRLLLERELAENPDDPFVLFQLGRLALQGRLPDALEFLRRAERLIQPGHPLARQVVAVLATALHELGRTAEARWVLREALAHFPNDTNLLFGAGSLAFEAGVLDEAEAAFSALLSAPPDPEELFGPVDLSLRGWQTRRNLAVVNHRLGRLGDAERHLRIALEEMPDDGRAWLALGEVYLAQGRWPELDGVLGRLAASPSADLAAHAAMLRARAHLARHEYPEARAVLEALIARRPEATEPLMLLCRACLLDDNDLDAAEQALRDVLAIDPGHSQARQVLATLLDEDEDEDEDEAAA
jgi:tetratricopeptide (TPR) repeat protein